MRPPHAERGPRQGLVTDTLTARNGYRQSSPSGQLVDAAARFGIRALDAEFDNSVSELRALLAELDRGDIDKDRFSWAVGRVGVRFLRLVRDSRGWWIA